ncbi:septum formation initiator family protein [Candidatus Uhrbacteria bacterium]|nr:septum formation initiator family protein [Candidatus Uhrbacteria bacterium]
MTARRSGRERSPLKALARWPVFLIGNVALLTVIGASTVRETYRGWTVDREIQALESQAASMEGRRMQLASLTEQFVSSERVEFEARTRLGMKKPDERVVVLQGFSAGSPSGDAAAAGYPDAPADPRSNPEKWRDYFFRGKQ